MKFLDNFQVVLIEVLNLHQQVKICDKVKDSAALNNEAITQIL